MTGSDAAERRFGSIRYGAEASAADLEQLAAYLRGERDWATPSPLVGPSVGAVHLTDGQVRQSWDEYFFEVARVVSQRATCPRAAIGVVLVDRRHRIVSTGYNGAPSRAPHCTEVGCAIFADHCVRSVHAEINAVDQAWDLLGDWGVVDREAIVRDGFLASLGVVAYVYGDRPVCSHCARSLLAAGVLEVRCRTTT